MNKIKVSLVAIAIWTTCLPGILYARDALDQWQVTHIEKGVPAPWSGILVTDEDMATLIARIHALRKEIQIYQAWCQKKIDNAVSEQQALCDTKTKFLLDVQAKTEHKRHWQDIALLIGIAIGALGLGVGLGVYLDKR